jgi:hypothetical protein
MVSKIVDDEQTSSNNLFSLGALPHFGAPPMANDNSRSSTSDIFSFDK